MKKLQPINPKLTFILIIIFVSLLGLGLYYISTTNKEALTPSINNSDKYLLTNLEIPWDIAFFENNIFVTQRPGRLLVISDGQKINYDVPDVFHNGEGGLLGIAVHPNFKENSRIYLYQTVETNNISNAIYSYQIRDGLVDRKLIIDNIPGATFHNGGRILFGPDNKLYVTTGDAQNPNLSQDTASLAGKILRLNEDGTIPNDNPFGNAVYSYGHRNPQGLAFDNNGNLWSTEHGSRGNDEINLIESGKNYGWPIIEGDQNRDDMASPVIHSGNRTWAPSGMTIIGNKILFGGLRSQAVYEFEITDRNLSLNRTYFDNEFGRIRKVAFFGSDIYILISNKDGRGIPRDGDDRIIVINKDNLESRW